MEEDDTVITCTVCGCETCCCCPECHMDWCECSTEVETD